MGRQEHQGRGEQVILHSSIALLQERFRQLQKVKEMRQERELLMAFSSKETAVNRGSSIPHLEQQQPSCFIHPGLLYHNLAPRTHHAVHSKATRPAWPVGEHQQFPTAPAAAGYGGTPPLGMGMLPNWALATNTPVNYAEEKDVDTSLHL